MTEEEKFYKDLEEVYYKISKAPRRSSLRWFLFMKGFSRWEINSIEHSMVFTKPKKRIRRRY